MLVIFDAETTGFTAGVNEMIQISAIVVDDTLTFVSEFTSLIKPRRIGLIDAAAMSVNKISMEALMSAPPSESVRESFLEWVADLNIQTINPCGWNYQFDRDFLRMFLGEMEYNSLFKYKAVDVYAIAWAMQRSGKLPKSTELSLSEVTRELGITHKPHDAFSDTYATWQVLKELLK